MLGCVTHKCVSGSMNDWSVSDICVRNCQFMVYKSLTNTFSIYVHSKFVCVCLCLMGAKRRFPCIQPFIRFTFTRHEIMREEKINTWHTCDRRNLLFLLTAASSSSFKYSWEENALWRESSLFNNAHLSYWHSFSGQKKHPICLQNDTNILIWYCGTGSERVTWTGKMSRIFLLNFVCVLTSNERRWVNLNLNPYEKVYFVSS
jgi:hypothetical protein